MTDSHVDYFSTRAASSRYLMLRLASDSSVSFVQNSSILRKLTAEGNTYFKQYTRHSLHTRCRRLPSWFKTHNSTGENVSAAQLFFFTWMMGCCIYMAICGVYSYKTRKSGQQATKAPSPRGMVHYFETCGSGVSWIGVKLIRQQHIHGFE